MQYLKVDTDEFTGMKVEEVVEYYLNFTVLERRLKEAETQLRVVEKHMRSDAGQIFKDVETHSDMLEGMEPQMRKEAAINYIEQLAKRRATGSSDHPHLMQLLNMYIVYDIEAMKVDVKELFGNYKEQTIVCKEARIKVANLKEECDIMFDLAESCFSTIPRKYRYAGTHPYHNAVMAFVSEWQDRSSRHGDPITIYGVSLTSLRGVDESLWETWNSAYRKLKLDKIPKTRVQFKSRSMANA